MPTNVTPEFRKAQEAYRRAREPAERLRWLREMLATVPKHKGTEHLQADLKSRIKEVSAETTGPKKGGRTGPVHSIPPEGAAQIALVGPPNSGKSSLHAKLTGSHAEIGAWPYTTHEPFPGMFPFEDIQFQLVDLPPIADSHVDPWIGNALRPAHAALLVVDLSHPGCVQEVAVVRDQLDERRVTLAERWPFDPGTGPAADPSGSTDADGEGDDEEEELDDAFRIALPTLLVAAKSDLEPDPANIEVLESLLEVRYPAIPVSVVTGDGLERIGPFLFRGLGVLRVYTRIPGQPPDLARPYTVFPGATVRDVAAQIHRELADAMRFARVWGRDGRFGGRHVGPDHPVHDGDVLELHE